MMRVIRPIATLGAIFVVAFVRAPTAFADDVTCPNGSVVTVGAGANSFDVRAACATDAGPSGTATETVGEADEDGSDQGGRWIYAGYVCDNGGICASQLRCGDGSPKMRFIFVYSDGSRGETMMFCPGDPDIPVAAVTPPTPGQIFTAFKRVAPKTSTLSVQPPGGKTLVNFETIFSTTAEPFATDPIRLVEGFSVEFEIAPQSFAWHFDDEHSLTTDWPGRRWSEGEDVADLISHVYSSTKDVSASVTTTWGATCSLNGGPGVQVDGTVDVTSPQVPLEILEAKPTLVR